MRWEENPHGSRLAWVYGMVAASILGLILRLGYLDVVCGKSFQERVGSSLTTRLGVLPNRGWIYDKDMHVLAYNAPSVSVVLSRFGVQKDLYPSLARKLAPILRVDEATLLHRMQENPWDKEVQLFENASNAQIAYIAEHQSSLPGVHCVEDVRRVYPFGSLGGHILGYIQPQPASEAQAYRRAGYLPEQRVGITGVERQYESILQGQPGYRTWQITSSGVPIKAFGLNPAPKPGESLRLTLDAPLQATAQALVMQQLEKVRKQHHIDPTDAEAVMLDAKSGGVLAMVSYPYYDPNWFIQSANYQKHRAYIENTRLTPIINHTLTSPRYPGSTVKPVNLLAAMDSGVITPYSRIQDDGKLMVGTYEAHDWMPGGHGLVDVPTAIQKSCDTYMYQVGMWMAHWYGGLPGGVSLTGWNQRDRIRGLNRMLDWEWKFGLGPKTGIDLPGEAAGRFYANDSVHHSIVPYDLLASERTMSAQHYVPNAGLLYDNAFAAIGQMQEFTPLQLAVYAMTIANDGVRYKPHLLEAVLSSDGKRVVRQVKPEVASRVRIPASHLRAVKYGMYKVANVQGGTAYRAFRGAPYTIAGKTGTAEVSQWGKKTDISLFIAYAPIVHPQVALAVMVPGGGESSDVAVPLARKLLDAYFAERRQSDKEKLQALERWPQSAAARATEHVQLP
ncbi:penicillin-binding transpeptidase domain-containing protein [Alicyclobacillus fastidiosus]|uniref:Penicillin-binding transpeptidase domain-containing protein n=1 Tax=Alicyclobacillus fastidiosus TaxID=392011 RepID=A0ABY6ZE55_9BACL|nr:penicillin-binding transpeptidase domain-containing protein [Alicyclobacillus fastidiosus]WAH40792.1 penicillin-binding transpeptidase domain-containing protein [Alicyclobacillus fastidiosus]GMA62270.1 penicillin-binding protein 2 [Alicyclobacillus fastidiosus]